MEGKLLNSVKSFITLSLFSNLSLLFVVASATTFMFAFVAASMPAKASSNTKQLLGGTFIR